MGTYLGGHACGFSLVVASDALDAFIRTCKANYGYGIDGREVENQGDGTLSVMPDEWFWIGDAPWGFEDGLKALLESCEPGSFLEVVQEDNGLQMGRFTRTTEGVDEEWLGFENPFEARAEPPAVSVETPYGRLVADEWAAGEGVKGVCVRLAHPTEGFFDVAYVEQGQPAEERPYPTDLRVFVHPDLEEGEVSRTDVSVLL